MPNISVTVKNDTSTDYRTHVYDKFGGGRAEVVGSPFPLASGDSSPPFIVVAAADGKGVVEYVCIGGPSLGSTSVADGDEVSVK